MTQVIGNAESCVAFDPICAVQSEVLVDMTPQKVSRRSPTNRVPSMLVSHIAEDFLAVHHHQHTEEYRDSQDFHLLKIFSYRFENNESIIVKQL